jgi:hypothetical protein
MSHRAWSISWSAVADHGADVSYRGPDCYSFTYGGVHFVGLNSVDIDDQWVVTVNGGLRRRRQR